MTASSPAPAATGFWRLAPGGLAFLFALAAPWSIAAAQSAVVAGAALLLAGILARRIRYPAPPLTLLLLLLFLAVQALSIPLGVDPIRSLRCFRGSWIFLFPFVFWGLLADREIRRRALILLGVSGALAGLYGIVQHFDGRDWLHQRVLENYGGGGFVAVGNLNDHLSYAGVLLPVFFLALGLSSGRHRILWIIGSALLGLGVLFSFARTAWIGAAAGLLALGLLRGRRYFFLVLAALAVIIAGAALGEPALQHRLLSVLHTPEDPRSRLWQTALRMAADHPWSGAGLGCYKILFPLYKVPGAYQATIHPHSDLLNVLVETGIPGLLAWVAIWAAFFVETGRNPGSGARPWRLDALRSGVVALLAAGLGQNYSTDEEVAQVWWFLAVAAILASRSGAGGEGSGRSDPHGGARRHPWHRLEKGFKASTLPLAARLLAGKPAPPESRGPGPQGNRERILVIRQDNRLGNLLLLTPFLQRLREAQPGAHIAFLCGEAFAPLLRAWPWVDEWIIQEKRRHARAPWLFLPWVTRLRQEGWDLAFEASNHNTHSYYNCLMALCSGAPERAGFDHPRSRSALTLAAAPPAELQHFSLAPLSLLRALGWEAPPAAMACPLENPPSPEFAAWRAQAGVERGYLLLHLGGRGAKAWPPAAWRALLPRIQALTEKPVVLVAGPHEQNRLASLRTASGSCLQAAPPLGIIDLAHLLRGASACVCSDSGAMHLAVALETPVVALFSHSNPYHYAPLGRSHRTVLLDNPYGVTEAEWARPVEGLLRSPLLRVDEADEVDPSGGHEGIAPRGVGQVADALRQVIREEAP